MSAFMCSNKHINIIVDAVLNGQKHLQIYNEVKSHWFDYQQLGEILTAANADSLFALYGETSKQMFTIEQHDSVSAVQVLKLCQCFDYQACEDGKWDHSIAKLIIGKCIDVTIKKLPEYDDAKWSIR